MGHLEHKERAAVRLRFAVITVSDTRRGSDDTGGKLLEELILAAGHSISGRHNTRDERGEIEELLKSLLDVEEIDLIVLTGGSGIARRDVTIESVSPFLEKTIDGFGELFRHLSYLQIGSSAIMSRAMAGVVRGKIVISIPGSEGAVRLAMEEIVLPEAGHMVLEARK